VATYSYTARRDRGTQFTGQVAADSRDAALLDLRRKGLTVLNLKEKRSLPDINAFLENNSRIKAKDKAVFARQFATMISSGLAVLRALHILEAQCENKRLARIVGLVRADVEAGMSLSDAMAKQPAAFDRLFVSMVKAGEAGGSLDAALNRLSTQLEKDDSLRRQIKSAMTYPTLIAVFAVVVLICMLLFVIPMFVGMFKSLGGKLPMLTQIMINLSNMMKGYWFILIPSMILFVYGIKRLKGAGNGIASNSKFL
jgi:type IV pilus assembly protein PilC